MHSPRAFAIFCEQRRHPDVSPAVMLLRTKMLNPGAFDIFARRDPLGKGFVCRVDLFDGLRELGVSGTPPAQVHWRVDIANSERLLALFDFTYRLIDCARRQCRSVVCSPATSSSSVQLLSDKFPSCELSSVGLYL